MNCKLCGLYVESKFYRHLNSVHRIRKCEYLNLFPDQKEFYSKQVPSVWNKGKNKENDLVMAKIAKDVAEYSNREEIKKKRSELLKKRYEKGDILDKETRKKVVKSASEGWVNKIKNASEKDRIEMLKNFTDAGNLSQKERRPSLTPEDYQKMYPFAKGQAKWHNCDWCSKEMIVWFGGKVRPEKRFCDRSCFFKYKEKHPFFMWKKCGSPYYSKKMKMEFYLRSNLERWLADILEDHGDVDKWIVTPFAVNYVFKSRSREYYPDFLINDYHVVEVKSKYVAKIEYEKTKCKLSEAEKYCCKNNFKFHYLEFEEQNLTFKKFKENKIVVNFLKSLKGDQDAS